MCDKIYKNLQLSTMNRDGRFSDKCNSPVAKKISAQWSALAGTRGCMRTGCVSGRERKTRRGCVARPKGTRGTLLTDWRPDRLHRPHSPRSWNSFLFIPLCSAFLCSLPFGTLGFAPSTSIMGPRPYTNQLHLSSFSFSPPPHLAMPPPPCLVTRHSQMSTGSCITETTRLSAVAAWHLKSCTWVSGTPSPTLWVQCTGFF